MHEDCMKRTGEKIMAAMLNSEGYENYQKLIKKINQFNDMSFSNIVNHINRSIKSANDNFNIGTYVKYNYAEVIDENDYSALRDYECGYHESVYCTRDILKKVEKIFKDKGYRINYAIIPDHACDYKKNDKIKKEIYIDINWDYSDDIKEEKE